MEQENSLVAQEGRLNTLARTILFVAIGLFPILVIPVAWFPFQLTKTFVFVVLIAVCAILYGISSWKSGSISIPRGNLPYVVLFLPVAYVLSTLLSQDYVVSIFGLGTETDTLFFVGLCAVVFFLTAGLVKTERQIRTFFTVILGSIALAIVFQLLHVVIPGGVLQVFSSSTSNLVGKWNDLGILMGFAAAFSLAIIEFLPQNLLKRIFVFVTLALSLALLIVINFSAVWWALLAAALIAGGLKLFSGKGSTAESLDPMAVAPTQEPLLKRIPVVSVIVAIIAGVLLLWGTAINTEVAGWFSISQLEVRPSHEATVEIARGTYAQSALTTIFGSGPNTFGQQWMLYKPVEVNTSQFWDIDFTGGYGAISSSFVTVGVLGGLAWLLLVLFVVFVFVGMALRPSQSSSSRSTMIISGVGSIFLLATAVFYLPNQVVFMLAFALLGVFAISASNENKLTLGLRAGIMPVLSLGLLSVIVIATAFSAGAISHRFMGSLHTGRALAAVSANDVPTAATFAQRAVETYRNDDSLRLLANVRVAQARVIAAETDPATAANRAERFQAAMNDAIANAQAITLEYPRNYQNWFTLAQVYQALIGAQVENAYQQSQIAYGEAIKRSPRNPGLYLAAARMEGAAGNEQNLRQAVSQALTLKPNYTDAILLIVQLEIAKQNLDGAINATAAAIQTAPQNAGLWFQLGVLAFNRGDDTITIQALEEAIKLVPEYANAKYFLGLSYYRAGRIADAAGQFDDLSKSNPESQEVILILNNIRAGKPPFDGATPPVENPTTRENAPIPE